MNPKLTDTMLLKMYRLLTHWENQKIYRNKIFLTSLVFAFGLLLVNKTEAQSNPNIIVIIADDMGWSDVGYNGSGIKTPYIDALQRSGIRLNYQYVMATCTPTRVGILTGKYASRFGVTGPDYGEVIPLGTPTMASLLKEKGYLTALIGKWHMGSPPHSIPINYGFTSAYGYFAGQIDPYTHRYKKDLQFAGSKTWNGEGAYIEHLKEKDGSQAQKDTNEERYGFRFLEEEGHVTDLLTDQAVRIIEEESNEPFFIWLAYSVPHYPLNEPVEWVSMYSNTYAYPSRALVAASISHMDAGIGQVIEALEKSGQRDNTLILFISDNGGPTDWSLTDREEQYEGRYKEVSHDVLGNNFPLRGWKGSLYEGGIRVPALVNWPEHLSPRTIDLPIKWTDWLPTILGLTGSNPEDLETFNFDGDNIWPLLTEKEMKKDFKNRIIFWETPGAYAIRDGGWKLIVDKKTGGIELYHIENDFREQHDVSNKYSGKIEELRKLLNDFR